MKKVLILLLFVFFDKCFAQNMGIIFKDYLPSAITKNKNFYDQAAGPITEFAKIHPDMIYFFIENLKAKFDTVTGDKYFSENFWKIKDIYASHFNAWLFQLEAEVKNEEIDDKLKNFCLDYLSDYEIRTKKVIPMDLSEKKDSNLSNFFIVKYYSQDKNIKYDETENYYKKRIELEKERSKLFNDMLNNPAKYEKEDLRNVIFQWNIFDDLDLNNQNIKASFIITQVLREYYLNKHLFSNWTLGIGYSYQHDYYTRSGSVYETSKFGNDNQTFYKIHPFRLSINYKQFLSKYIGMLSYLNLEVVAGFGIDNNLYQLEDLAYRNTKVDGVSNRVTIFGFYKNEAKIKDYEFIELNLTTPLIFIGQTMSIDGGIGLSVFQTNYEITYDYYYRKFESEFAAPRIIETEYGNALNKKETSLDIYFNPIIYFKYYAAKPYVFQFIASIDRLAFEAAINL